MNAFSTISKLHGRANKAKWPKHQYGIALVTLMLLLLMMMLIGGVGLRMAGQQETMSNNVKQLTRAQFAAEQGVREAMDLNIPTLAPDPFDGVNDDVTDPNADIFWTYTNSGSGTDYAYNFIISFKIANGTVAANGDGLPYYVIKSAGTSGNAARRIEVALVHLFSSESAFDTAFIGCRGIPFNSNAEIGSYTSDGSVTDEANGDIKTLEADADIDLNSGAIVNGTVRATRDIIMNSDAVIQKDAYANRDITLDSNAEIVGNAFAGRVIDDSNSSKGVAGTKNPAQTPAPVDIEDCDPLKVDDAITNIAAQITSGNNDNSLEGLSSSYEESSSNLTLGSAGNDREYYFTCFNVKAGTVNVEGNVTMFVDAADGSGCASDKTGFILEDENFNIAADANLKLYVNGKFYVKGTNGITIADNANGVPDPSNFLIFTNVVDNNTSGDPSVWMDSNAQFMGVVYAPFAYVKYDSNTNGYGTVRGRWAELNSNADFLYDEGLANTSEGIVMVDLGYEIVYWTEDSYESYGAFVVTTTTTTTGGTTSSTGGGTTSSTSASTTSTAATTTAASTTTTTQSPPFSTNLACRSGDSFADITLDNNSGSVCIVTGFEISWPSANGSLKEIQVDEDKKIYDQEESCCSATIRGSWLEGESQRTISAGGQKTFNFKFDNAAANGAYEFIINTTCGLQTVSSICN